MEPFTKAYPKELLPVGEKAVIEHCIDNMKQAGIDEIIVVVSWKQHAVLDYLGSGKDMDVKITYVVQEDKDGLAGAVKAAEHLIDDRFVVLLGDNYVDRKHELHEFVKFHQKEEFNATVAAFRPDNITSYGVIEPAEDNKVERLVEKPDEDEVSSNIAVAGMYVFEPKIFEAIDEIERGKEGEYQLTDAIDRMISEGHRVGYKAIEGSRIDVGTPERLRQANREFDLRE